MHLFISSTLGFLSLLLQGFLFHHWFSLLFFWCFHFTNFLYHDCFFVRYFVLVLLYRDCYGFEKFCLLLGKFYVSLLPDIWHNLLLSTSHWGSKHSGQQKELVGRFYLCVKSLRNTMSTSSRFWTCYLITTSIVKGTTYPLDHRSSSWLLVHTWILLLLINLLTHRSESNHSIRNLL